MAEIILLAVFAAVAGACALLAAYRRRVEREFRELDAGLPAHTIGPLHTGRSARRSLYRDLVLLLVVNTPENGT